MTVSHAAAMLTTIWTIAATVMFLATGSLMWGGFLIAAPLPMQLARMSDRESWSVMEALRGRRDDHGVSDALDHALRAPTPTPRLSADDAYFVPDCPRLDGPMDEVTIETAPRATTPPISTPLR